MLISLIDNSKFVVANDTGPAHIASHLNKKGLVLFGNHTSPEKVSIESKNFKALSAKKLSDLSVESVIHELKFKLNLYILIILSHLKSFEKSKALEPNSLK